MGHMMNATWYCFLNATWSWLECDWKVDLARLRWIYPSSKVKTIFDRHSSLHIVLDDWNPKLGEWVRNDHRKLTVAPPKISWFPCRKAYVFESLTVDLIKYVFKVDKSWQLCNLEIKIEWCTAFLDIFLFLLCVWTILFGPQIMYLCEFERSLCLAASFAAE